MEFQLHQHFDPHIDPSCSLHKATLSLLDWNTKKEGSKKDPKVWKYRLVFGKARVRTGRVGTLDYLSHTQAPSPICGPRRHNLNFEAATRWVNCEGTPKHGLAPLTRPTIQS